MGGGKNDIRRFCHPADADINAGTTQRYLESFKSCQNIKQTQGYKKKNRQWSGEMQTAWTGQESVNQ